MTEFARFEGKGGRRHEGIIVTQKGLQENPDSANRDMALMVSGYLSNEDVLRIAAARGLAPGILGAQYYNQAHDWIYKQIGVNVEAMRDLGFQSADIDTAPTADAIVENLDGAGMVALGQQIEFGRSANLMLMPNVSEVGLFGDSQNPGLITRYNRKEGKKTQIDTTGFTEFWGSISDKDRMHDPLAGTAMRWTFAFMLGSAHGNRVLNGVDRFGEDGLIYDNMDSDDQRKVIAADAETDEFGPNFQVGSANVVHYVVRCAILRTLGHPLLDSRHGQVDTEYQQARTLVVDPERDPNKLTATNLINYDDIKPPSRSAREIPAAFTRGGRIIVSRRRSSADRGAGVRKVVQYVPPASKESVKT